MAGNDEALLVQQLLSLWQQGLGGSVRILVGPLGSIIFMLEAVQGI